MMQAMMKIKVWIKLGLLIVMKIRTIKTMVSTKDRHEDK